MSNSVYFLTNGFEKKVILGGASNDIKMYMDKWEAFKEEMEGDNSKIISEMEKTFAPFADDLGTLFCEPTESILSKMEYFIRGDFEICIEKLFFIWKSLIEAAASQILKENRVAMPDFPNDLDTSSPIIYYFMYNRGKYKKQRQVFKNISFDYKGFCPLERGKRLELLLEFPIGELFSMTPILDLPAVYSDIYSKLESLNKLNEICEEKLPKLPKFEGSRIDHLFKIYEILLPFLENRENKMIKMAKKFDEVSYIIQHEILNTFL